MEESLDLVCPSCNGITRKALDWLRQHSECLCDSCGSAIAVGTNKQWGESKRMWNAEHHDGSPPRRRLP
jgi:hypothetical protein